MSMHRGWVSCHARSTSNRPQQAFCNAPPGVAGDSLAWVPHTMMTTFPRAWPASRYRRASATSRSA
jgi:hypothetical protein